jgi:AraC-like DNA-binding protein
MSFLLAYWQQIQSSGIFYQILFFLAIQLPFALWLLSKSMFDDDFQWTWKFWLLLAAVPAIHYLLYQSNSRPGAGLSDDFRFFPYLLSVIFIILAIVESLKNREDDLVLSRLRKRNVFMLFSSLLALVSVFFFFTNDPLHLPLTFELIQNTLSCIFILWFFGSQFSYQRLFSETEKSANISAEEKDKEKQQRIISKMLDILEKEGLFTSEGLTISKLADHTGEKEYLLRRAINGELGFTNFNAFLNHYRIREACRLLSEEKEEQLTFQEIAYRMGYQSVATFNRAFKKETGQTPTEYNKSQ